MFKELIEKIEGFFTKSETDLKDLAISTTTRLDAIEKKIESGLVGGAMVGLDSIQKVIADMDSRLKVMELKLNPIPPVDVIPALTPAMTSPTPIGDSIPTPAPIPTPAQP